MFSAPSSSSSTMELNRKSLLLLSLLALVLLASPSSSAANGDDNDSIIARFQQYLQINTSEPNPAYAQSTDFLLSEAKSLSLESRTIYYVSGKPVVLLKWPGSNPSLPSVLLNSHTDVQLAEADKWSHPPFAADIDAGRIYARGTQDMKSVGMQYLEAIRKLKLSGFTPLRNVYLSYMPGEILGARDGTVKLAESDEFRDMNVGIVLDDGLALETKGHYRVFHADRSAWWLVIKATGEPGHGAKVDDGTAAENLVKSIDSVMMFRASQFAMLKAGLKTKGEVYSVNLVYLKAGYPSPTGFVMNLQPSEAEAGFDVRLPPTADPKALMQRIEEEWAPISRNMTYEFKLKDTPYDESGNPFVTPTNTAWWTLLEEAVIEANGTLGSPEIIASTSDARFYRAQGVPVIGFAPMTDTPWRLYDHNEFLNETEYLKGIKVYESIIKAFASYAGSVGGGYSRDEL